MPEKGPHHDGTIVAVDHPGKSRLRERRENELSQIYVFTGDDLLG